MNMNLVLIKLVDMIETFVTSDYVTYTFDDLRIKKVTTIVNNIGEREFT